MKLMKCSRVQSVLVSHNYRRFEFYRNLPNIMDGGVFLSQSKRTGKKRLAKTAGQEKWKMVETGERERKVGE